MHMLFMMPTLRRISPCTGYDSLSSLFILVYLFEARHRLDYVLKVAQSNLDRDKVHLNSTSFNIANNPPSTSIPSASSTSAQPKATAIPTQTSEVYATLELSLLPALTLQMVNCCRTVQASTVTFPYVKRIMGRKSSSPLEEEQTRTLSKASRLGGISQTSSGVPSDHRLRSGWMLESRDH